MVFIIFVYITGCSANNDSLLQGRTIQPETADVNMQIKVVTETATTTSTQITPTYAIIATLEKNPEQLINSTITPSITPTPPPSSMEYKCLEILDELPQNSAIQGVIAFDTPTDSWLYNFTEQKRIDFPHSEEMFDLQVSPDNKRMIYYRLVTNNDILIVMVDPEGKQLWQNTVRHESGIVWETYGWFDKEQLWLWKVMPMEDYLIITNPFTGDQTQIETDDYVGYELAKPNIWGWTAPFTKYDPFLTLVVYPAWLDTSKDVGYYVLKDLNSSKIFAKLITPDNFGTTPIWLSDGSKVIMVANAGLLSSSYLANEFFTIDRKGEIEQLTNFSDDHNEVVIYDNYSISPDNRYLAFWIVTKPGLYIDDRLAILDIATGKVVNYCLPGDPILQNASYTGVSAPIWSPDSNQLLFVSNNDEGTEKRYVILVDLVQQSAAKIAEDVEPKGWMIAP